MSHCELKPYPTQLTGPTKALSTDTPHRWALVAIRINGDLECLSETRATREEALAEAQKLATWWQVSGVGIAPVSIDLARLEVIQKPPAATKARPLPLQQAAEDRAIRSLDGIAS